MTDRLKASTCNTPAVASLDAADSEPAHGSQPFEKPLELDNLSFCQTSPVAIVPTSSCRKQESKQQCSEHAGVTDVTKIDKTISLAHLRGIIEAMVFASDKPLTVTDIAKTANAPRDQVMQLLAEIQSYFSNRGIRLVQVAEGYAFRTAAAYGSFVRQVTDRRAVKMTRAQLETIAIVAYRQPITRAEVDDIRGVDSGAVLKTLLERGVLRIIGKRNEPGRPIIYGTTTEFLTLFNLKSLKDLPTLRDIAELSEESKRTFDKLMSRQQMPLDISQQAQTSSNSTKSYDISECCTPSARPSTGCMSSTHVQDSTNTMESETE